MVPRILGAEPTWNLNPIGKLITFGKDSVTFDKTAYPVLGYRLDEFESYADFEAIYGISTKKVGVGPHQVAINAQLTDRNEQGIAASEVYPLSPGHIILNWDRWFLAAVPARNECRKDQ
jgi:hypothetical protein